MSEQRSGRQTIADISELKVKPTGSSTLVKVADHLSGFVNVRSYGAKGDGITDDTAAIQAAIGSGARIIDGGGALYAVSEVRGRSDMTLRHLRIKKLASSVDGLNVLDFESFDPLAPISNVVIDDVHIDGNRGQQTNIVTTAEDGGRSGFRFRGYVNGVTISRSSARFCGTDGLILYASQPTPFAIQNVTVIDSEFSDNRRHGISGDSLKNVRFVRTKANRNGLTLNGQTDVTHGDHGSVSAGSLYGNGADIESYKAGDHSGDLAFLDCEMIGNARGGLILLEKPTFNDVSYQTWRNVAVRGGKYDEGVDASNEGHSIIITPNTATYTPGARKFISGVRVSEVDLVNGSILFRYAEAAEVNLQPHSVATPVKLLVALCESVVHAEALTPSQVEIAEGAAVSYRSHRPGIPLLTPGGVTVLTGAGALSSVVVTKLSESTGGVMYRITGIYTPAAAPESARLRISTVANAQVLGGGLTNRTTGLVTGRFGALGRNANISVDDSTPVDVEMAVLVY
jgi:hypothetical protein